MAEGRQRHEWAQTSAILWLIAEVNRNPKKRKTPYTPADFDPTHKRPIHGDLPKADITILRDVFVRPKNKEVQA